MSKLLLGQARHDALAVRMEPSHAQDDLRAAKANPGYGLCECVDPPRKLVVRERNGVLHLAVWPEDGPCHRPGCVFWHDAAENTGLRDFGGAVVEREDGFHVTPAFSLMRATRSDAGATDADAGASSHGEAARFPGLPLLGLLHYVWDQARLNRWSLGWRRDYWRVVRELREVAQHGHLGRHALHDCLYIPPAFRADRVDAINAELDTFLDTLRPMPKPAAVRSGLVLGRITSVQPSSHGHRMTIGHMRTPAYVSDTVYQAMAKQFARGVHVANFPSDATTLCVGLLHVEISLKGHLRVIDAALMVVTRDYIPVDSTYEARMALQLVRRNRTFSKPLGYGTREGLPSFMLLDTEKPVHMEVCGLGVAAVQERLAAKMRQHAQEGRAVWLWDASRGQQCPEVPPPRRKTPPEMIYVPSPQLRSAVPQD